MRSIAATSFASSTTQMSAGLRRGSRQIEQRSCSDTLPHTSQKRTFSRTSPSSFDEARHVERRRLQDVERDALRRLRPDAREAPELVDQVLDDAVVHGLAEPRRRLVRLFAHERRAEHLAHDGLAVALHAVVAGGVAVLGSRGATTGGTGTSATAFASMPPRPRRARSTARRRRREHLALARRRERRRFAAARPLRARRRRRARRVRRDRRRGRAASVGIDATAHSVTGAAAAGAVARAETAPAPGVTAAGGRRAAHSTAERDRRVVLGEILHADAEHGQDRLAQVFARTRRRPRAA